jgi:hypothetical protein
MHPRLPKKEIGLHHLDIRIAMAAVDCFSAADNTTLEVGSGSNFCTCPNDCVLHDGTCVDPAFRPDDRGSFDACRRIDQRAFRDGPGPIRLF